MPTRRPCDMVIVTGGPGWIAQSQHPPTLDYLRRVATQHPVASVCTGAMILAASGVLDGRAATTKREVVPPEEAPIAVMERRYPAIDVREASLVDSGHMVTGGGVALCIDATLHILQKMLGAKVARETARILEYDRAWAANLAGFPAVTLGVTAGRAAGHPLMGPRAARRSEDPAIERRRTGSRIPQGVDDRCRDATSGAWPRQPDKSRTMKPTVICHMLGSVDGRLHPSRYTESPDGDRKDWSALYEKAHDDLAADGWMVGRVTMAEMSKAAGRIPRRRSSPWNGRSMSPGVRRVTRSHSIRRGRSTSRAT